MEVDNLRCSDCKNQHHCPNLQHPRISRRKASFSCCANSLPCLRFEPIFNVYEAQTKDMVLWWRAFEAEWLPKPLEKSTVSLIIDNNEKVWYMIHLSDWIAGTFLDNGCLRAFEKKYFEMTKRGCGYKIVTERISGISLNEHSMEENNDNSET